MQKTNNIFQMKCVDIEQLLMKKYLNLLTEDENSSVELHLRSCSNCRDFQNILPNLQAAVLFNANDPLIPNNTIRNKIIQRMREQKSSQSHVLTMAWNSIKSLLQYKIPVYQALFAAVSILLLVIALHRFTFSIVPGSTNLHRHVPSGSHVLDKTSLVQSLDLIDRQKIGRNVQEDSILARYIVRCSTEVTFVPDSIGL